MEVKILEKKRLTDEEKAYILDQLCRTSYYEEKFGTLDKDSERQIIVSIFLKLQTASFSSQKILNRAMIFLMHGKKN